MRKTISTLLIFAGAITGVAVGLKCYACVDCAENGLQVQDCTNILGLDIKSDHCLKTVTNTGVITRSCSIPCVDKLLQTGESCKKYDYAEVCLCKGDKCNAATTTHIAVVPVITALLTSFVLMMINYP